MEHKVIDDVVGLPYQNLIEQTINSQSFEWYYVPTLTYEEDSEHSGFVNTIFSSEHHIKKQQMDILLPLLLEGVEDVKEVFRIRAVMWVKNQNKSPHLPHRDLNHDHNTMLYYVNDSDGPTKIFDGDNVIDEIEPKKGRAVIFSGDTYHASSTPRKNHNRVVLNFNYGI